MPRSDPHIALIAFDGPFTTEAELCKRTIDSLVADDMNLDLSNPYVCVTEGPSFELAAPALPSSRDRVTAAEPWRAVHVAAVATTNQSYSASQCLLVIETPRGWFASDRMIEHCERSSVGSAFQPVGGFQVVDVMGDSGPELVVERGEQHRGACGDCDTKLSTSRAICGIDRRGAPRCTPPIATTITNDDNGRSHHRRWEVERDGWLVVGQFPRLDDQDHEVPSSTVIRWMLDFDR